jgi:hypothetical protein
LWLVEDITQPPVVDAYRTKCQIGEETEHKHRTNNQGVRAQPSVMVLAGPLVAIDRRHRVISDGDT